MKNLLLLLVVLTQNCYGQQNKPDSLINRFRNDVQIVQKEHAGVVMMDDETKLSYYLVLSNCTISDLIKYTNDTNAFIRASVFAGLARKKVNQNVLLKISDAHKNDTATFTEQSADLVTTWTVKQYMQFCMDFRSRNKQNSVDYKERIEKIRSQSTTGIKIDGLHHGLIEKDDLLKIDSLVFIGNQYRIVSFTLYAAGKAIKSAGNILTDDMKNAIKETTSGERLFFEDIKAVGGDNRVRQLNPLSLKLK